MDTIASLSVDVQDVVDEFGTLRVVAFRPSVPSTRLTKDEILWTQTLPELAHAGAIHRSSFEIYENRSRNVAVIRHFVDKRRFSAQAASRVSVCAREVDAPLNGPPVRRPASSTSLSASASLSS